MNWVRNSRFSFALAALLCGSAQAAMISLDTAGADPDLTSPTFSFMTDMTGAYAATYRNVSNPPQDFIRLTLFATFSASFYNSSNGPAGKGVFCNHDNVFTSCSVTIDPVGQPPYTLEFDFFGIDATHPGLPYLGSLNLTATAFEPGQMISANAVTVQATATPEPGTAGVVLGGALLLSLGVFRKQFLKLRIVPQRA